MKFIQNLIGGLAGAITLNLLHETIRRFDPDAPRVDLVGEEALNKAIEAAGGEALEGKALYAATLAGDILSNALYYSAIGTGKDRRLLARGILIGASGGIGALKFTRPMKLHDEPITQSQKTKWMTVAYYLAGGLVTATVIKALRAKKTEFGFVA